MPISLRRWKQKATQYINEKFRATGEGTLNHDLKVYLELSEFKPLFEGSVERINHGADEDKEIEAIIRELARQTLSTAMEVGAERYGDSRSSSSSSSEPRVSYGFSSSPRAQPSAPAAPNTIQYADDTMHLGGNGIHHHYYYY